MNILEIKIKGYRLFYKDFSIELNPGLNVLIGENGCGKTSIIDAIRLLFSEDEYGRTGISENDFHKFVENEEVSSTISINCIFNGLNHNDKLAFLTWLDGIDTSKAKLNLQIENIQNEKGYFNKRQVWGGEAISGLFEWKVMDKISCIYLPPLRDAENKLNAYRGSRLARLFKNLVPKEKQKENRLVTEVKKYNEELTKDSIISDVDKSIRNQLKIAIGNEFGQDTLIQFSEASFSKIVENLRLLFFPWFLDEENRKNYKFRDLVENSLGYNNLIYIATILAEMESYVENKMSLKILLIEEPEAHLHPQLQIRLLEYLQTKAKEKKIQIIVTTHSPTIAASVDLNCIIVITKKSDNPISTPISKCGLTKENKFFLERWLDITKSTLLFSRGVLFVEGIAEALVVPELAKIFIKEFNQTHQEKLPTSLGEAGISIINMNGIYFDHFMQLFKGFNENRVCAKITIRSAGITDCDPDTADMPTPEFICECKNPKFSMIEELKSHSTNCRLYGNLKTFEYDLAMEDGNLKVMLKLYSEYKSDHPELSKKALNESEKDWDKKSYEKRKKMAKWILDRISKGEYAQYLADKLREGEIILAIPDYIKKAILWVMRGDDDLSR